MTTSLSGRRYLRFALLALAVTAGLIALGWIPTLRRAGAEALPSLIAGCTVSFAAGLAGGLVLKLADPESNLTTGAARSAAAAWAMTAGLQAMGVRLLVLVALGSAIGFADMVPLEPFLLWMVISYLALLPVETRFALIDVSRGANDTSRDE